MDVSEYIRLHITPFNSTLLTTIIPASVLSNARNISYHEIQTLPEKAYGFVELPIMDAEKLKKKLNGTILKGTKVRIERAREEKKTVIESELVPPKRERKQKRKRDELPGVDIGERRVKRGWTSPAKDVRKDQIAVKSKYTTGPECLFKTNLPPNVASQVNTAKVKPEKRKRKPGKEVVVHEFAKTKKYATFLRGSAGSNKTKIVAEFVEGKGWIDEESNIVEEAHVKKPRQTEPALVKEERIASEEENLERAEPADQMDVDSDADKESSSDSDSADEPDAQGHSTGIELPQQEGTEISSVSSSSDEEDAGPALAKPVEQSETVSTGDSSDDSSGEELDRKSASRPTPCATKVASDSSSSSGESSDEEPAVGKQVSKEESYSSSVSSKEDSDSDSSSSSEADSEVEEPHSAITIKSPISTIPALSIKIPDSLTSTPIVSSVHPLEALYKYNATNQLRATNPSFSFFGADDDDDTIAEPRHQVPSTPFTQKDYEYRGVRSAAPTPDTAHPNRKFVWPTENDQDERDEALAGSPIRKGEAKGKGKEIPTEPESDFQKWFYENRGDVRRAWTSRRKSAAKEKRQQENRKRDRRAI
ncbi:hypothetical protein QTJ16_005921 [Diplocarpon rosae]|uniref:Uncharacterized protein n=1 Tax=Diplocarpon rosae TaxID=946125 RepID=A0AAD9SUA5_9HELO|nr:hypothetical protein QTJ16_005921 [Diplocarpon rosae]